MTKLVEKEYELEALEHQDDCSHEATDQDAHGQEFCLDCGRSFYKEEQYA